MITQGKLSALMDMQVIAYMEKPGKKKQANMGSTLITMETRYIEGQYSLLSLPAAAACLQLRRLGSFPECATREPLAGDVGDCVYEAA